VDWDNDNVHDLLVGDVNGGITYYRNTGSNTNPTLDSGSNILNTGLDRATPIVDDWNRDGKKDLLVGNLTGTIQVYLNGGPDAAPSFGSAYNLMVGGVDFDVQSTDPNGRSAPRIYDFNGDGLKDILTGEYNGYVYYLENDPIDGSNSAPVFKTAEKLLLLNGNPLRYINNPASEYPRSRIDIVDWNNDGLPDLVSGGNDGRIMLFTAVAPEPLSTTLFIAGSVVLGLSRLRKKFKDNNK
jgi:hypothetical protein